VNDAIKEVGQTLSDLRQRQVQEIEGKHEFSLMTTVCSHTVANSEI
jgi:hypothetical protein